MATRSSAVMFWAPRVLSLLFAGFLSLFALDVFAEGKGFLATLGDLAIHLVPVYMVLLTLWVAWKREWVGTLVYSALGVAYIFMAGARFPWQTLAVISGPLFLMAALFLGSWRARQHAVRA
jgi:hypothetical protein